MTIEVNDMVNTNPSITSHTVDLTDDGVIGSVYYFKARALNYAGYLDSGSLAVALASLPDQPVTPPESDELITNTSRLGVSITLFDETNNGGSPILIYNLQYDDGNRGDFQDIYTLSPSTIISNIISGA